MTDFLSSKNRFVLLEAQRDKAFEAKGIFNPAAIEKDGIINLFYRAVSSDDVSSIGLCQIKNGQIIFRSPTPILSPQFDYEKQGTEDPRVTFLDGVYYLLYTAYDGLNARIALATSQDLKTFIKRGPISPNISYDLAEDFFKKSVSNYKYTFFEREYKANKSKNILLWEKDAVLFPKKINGQFALIHRVLPGIQVCYFNDFTELTNEFWINYFKNLKKFIILNPKFNFENDYIGAGCPPIETKFGWLLIYHVVEQSIDKGRIYRASAALLDLKNPQKVISRLSSPLFSPTKKWERFGNVNYVVFPTGAIVNHDKLTIFYGAADQRIGIVELSLSKLLIRLISVKNSHP